MEQLVLDCHEAPNDPRCKGSHGTVFTATYAFPKPPTSALQFLIGGGYSHGFLNGGTLPSGGLDIGVSYIQGLTGPLPGPEGGGYHGFVAEAITQVYGGGAIFTSGNKTLGSGALLLRPQLHLGYEFESFGGFGTDDMSQHSVGVFVAYALGAQYTLLSGDVSTSSTDFAHGPIVGVELGRYQPMQRNWVRGFVRTQLLFVGSSNTPFLGVGGGAAFP